MEPIGNLISIFSDLALTVSITNPQTTDSFGFSGNKVYVSGKYSLRVNTVLGVQFILDLDAGTDAGAGTTTLDTVLGTNAITASGASAVVGTLVDKEVYTLVVANTNDGTSGVTLKIDSTDELDIVKNFNQPIDPGDFEQFQIIRVAFNETSNNYAWVDASVKTKRLTKGSDIISAASITVPDNDGNYFDITGSVTIAAINGVAGTEYTFQMDAAVTFTNSASLIMFDNADYTTTAGDVLKFQQLTSTTVINTSISNPLPIKIKGEIITRTATNLVALTVGADDEILIADSSEGVGIKWGPVSVSQGNLNTATGDMASTAGVTTFFTGPAGEFGFVQTLKLSDTSTTNIVGGAVVPMEAESTFVSFTVQLGTTLAQRFMVGAKVSLATARERYVTASKPYDLGDGVIHSFLFLRIMKVSGKILSSTLSPDPVWANNGPTDIRPEFVDKNGKKFRTTRRLKEEASLEDDDPFDSELIEITSDFKNSDMDLIPHPFQGNDLSDNIVVMIDPISKIVENLEIMKNSGDTPLDLFHNDYIRIDNTELNMGAPNGVIIYSAKMTNKLRT